MAAKYIPARFIYGLASLVLFLMAVASVMDARYGHGCVQDPMFDGILALGFGGAGFLMFRRYRFWNNKALGGKKPQEEQITQPPA